MLEEIMQPCRRATLAAAVLGLCLLTALAPALPAGAGTPLRPAAAAGPSPDGSALPTAATAPAAGVDRITARASAACTAGFVYDDGEMDEAIRFGDDVTGTGFNVDAVMRFDLGAETGFLDQMCICWNQENASAAPPDSFEHDLVFFRADGPGGQPGTVIATLPAIVDDPPPPLQTIFFEYDLTGTGVEITDPTVYAGVRWRSADAGDQGLALCIDQDGPGNQPMWARFAPPDPSAWSPTDVIFAGSPVAPPTALMVRLELLPAEPCPTTPCVPDATTLCLNGDRFRVETDWRIVQGGEETTGQGMAGDPLTDDTGYFWFFNPDNVEVVVKALDGCGVNDRYWIFAGGLTNVEVEMRVCDTQAGVQRTYFNPLDTRFQPIQDTAAFQTCP